MRQFFEELKDFRRKGDWVLLILCLITSGFGMIAIASATNPEEFGGNTRYILIQLLATVLGVMVYAVVSSIDVDFMSEHRAILVAFNVFLLLLLIPFGDDHGSGNKSWLSIPLVPVSIQPAEICKVAFILILASVMSSHQNDISSIKSVMHILFHLALVVGLNMVLSGDAGVSLIFVFIFIGMAFAGGISLWWFLAGIAAVAAAIPFVWPHLGNYQRLRIQILFDSSIDAAGTGARYHSKMNLQTITGGGLTGQGLFNGTRTQARSMYAQHTDYIFSSIGEELGFVGCLAVMLLEIALIARCIQVGARCPDYMRRLICYGAASAMMFQVIINVGMCIGVMPVIGLTLPLVSYGGSSVVTIYGTLGLVSGAYARPQSLSHERYIQPYRDYR